MTTERPAHDASFSAAGPPQGKKRPLGGQQASASGQSVGAFSAALTALRQRLQAGPVPFADVLQFVDAHYVFTPTAFTVGAAANLPGANPGSARVLGLALLEGFSDLETRHAFGEHVASVEAEPQGSSHPNLRAWLGVGLAGVQFAQPPLQRR